MHDCVRMCGGCEQKISIEDDGRSLRVIPSNNWNVPARPLARVQFAVYAYGLIHNCAHYQVQNQFRFRPPCKKSRGCKRCAPPSPFPSSLLLLCRLQKLREESDLDTSRGSPSCPLLLPLFCVARVGEDISGDFSKLVGSWRMVRCFPFSQTRVTFLLREILPSTLLVKKLYRHDGQLISNPSLAR